MQREDEGMREKKNMNPNALKTCKSKLMRGRGGSVHESQATWSLQGK